MKYLRAIFFLFLFDYRLIFSVNSELEAFLQHTNEINARRSELNLKQTELEESMQSHRQQESFLVNSIRQKESEHAEQSRNSSDRSRNFGPKIPQILADVSKYSFRGKVIGPIGMHISLSNKLDPRFAGLIVERLIKFHAKNFIVFDPDDRAALAAIIRKHNAYNEHQILLLQQHARYAVTSMPSDVVSALDLVDINDPDVFNAIVDGAALERVIVIQVCL